MPDQQPYTPIKLKIYTSKYERPQKAQPTEHVPHFSPRHTAFQGALTMPKAPAPIATQSHRDWLSSAPVPDQAGPVCVLQDPPTYILVNQTCFDPKQLEDTGISSLFCLAANPGEKILGPCLDGSADSDLKGTFLNHGIDRRLFQLTRDGSIQEHKVKQAYQNLTEARDECFRNQSSLLICGNADDNALAVCLIAALYAKSVLPEHLSFEQAITGFAPLLNFSVPYEMAEGFCRALNLRME